jgi:hypothetical protein
MTIAQAEEIIDVVSVALQTKNCEKLRKYDQFQIDAALKIRIAGEYLSLSRSGALEEHFESGLNLYGGIPFQLGLQFPEFNPIDPATMKFKDQRFADLESASSFGEFCKSIEPEDPDFWAAVYARIGIPLYVATSKRSAEGSGLSKRPWWRFW